jgi:hypothetical protein
VAVLKPGDKLEVVGELNQTCDYRGVCGASVGNIADPKLELSREVYAWIDDTVTQDWSRDHCIQVHVTIEVLAVDENTVWE